MFPQVALMGTMGTCYQDSLPSHRGQFHPTFCHGISTLWLLNPLCWHEDGAGTGLGDVLSVSRGLIPGLLSTCCELITILLLKSLPRHKPYFFWALIWDSLEFCSPYPMLCAPGPSIPTSPLPAGCLIPRVSHELKHFSVSGCVAW